MIHLKRGVWATAAAIAVAGGATAQTTGTTTTGTTTTTTVQQGGPTATLSGQQASPIQIETVEPPTITSTSSGAVQQSNVVATSNGFAAYYANPLWQGRAGAAGTGLTTVVGPGGFGQAVYGTNGGASGASGAGGTGGAASRATGRTGATGAQGTTLGGATTAGRTGGALGSTTGGLGGTGRTGTTGFGTTGRGGSTTQSQTAQQLSTGRQIAYTQTLRFPAIAPVPPAQLQADLQTMLTTSFNGGGVQATLGDGGVVVLRGQVADDDEARSVAGMVLLTPGVKEVKNELTIK